jgi:glycosyltransferase involved in cell wall biosynthesis
VDILLVIDNLGGGGAQRVLTTLANSWSRRGLRVCILTFAGQDRNFFPLDPTIKKFVVQYAPPQPTLFQLRGQFRFRHLWAALRYGLVWLMTLRRTIRRIAAPIVVSFECACNIKVIVSCLGLSGIRLVISERTDPERDKYKTIWKALRYMLYRYADVATANSQNTLEKMQSYVPKPKLVYVANPLCRRSEAPVVPASRRHPTLLAVGRLQPPKAYDVMLRAFSLVVPAAAHWRLAIVGSGPLANQLRVEADRLSLDSRVLWLGWQPDPFSFYRAADIFLMPSRYEGMPNALLEAMNEGLPPIVTDAMQGALELVEHEVSGLVVPVEDHYALAEAIKRLINDEALRHRLGENARRRAQAHTLPAVLPIWDRILGMCDV